MANPRSLSQSSTRHGTPLGTDGIANRSRPTVTIVAGMLQKAGLITYQRGQVTIKDREGLEAASCECYRVATELLQDVLRA
jgi:Mn-dependent DtxR family transcriptional regulator